MTTETKRYRLIYGKGKTFGKDAAGTEFFDTREGAYNLLKAMENYKNEAPWTWYELATHDDEGTWRRVDVQRPE